MKKRKIVALALASFALVSCAGGGGGGEDTSTFTLQIFVGGYGSTPWQKALEKFEADHPEYNVVANMSNTVNATFADSWMNGNPPDFVFLDGNLDLNTWLKEGLLYDLSDWLETAKVAGSDTLIKDKINSSYFLTHTDSSNKTTICGAPLILSAWGMWYDGAMFDEKGWNYPKNFTELKAFAGNASSEMNTLIYTGVYSGYLVQGMLVPAFAEYGETFFDRVINCRDAEVYDTAEFKDVLNRFNEFINLNDYVVSDCLSMNHIESQSEWLQHKATMIPSGLWLRSEMSALDAIPDGFEMRYSPSPLVKEKQTLVTSSVSCAIAKEAKNKKAAEEFLTYLYTDDIMKEFVYASDAPSVAPIDLSNDPNVTDVNRYIQTVFNDKSYAHVTNGNWGSVEGALDAAVNSLVNKSITVDDAIASVKAAAVKELKERQ